MGGSERGNQVSKAGEAVASRGPSEVRGVVLPEGHEEGPRPELRNAEVARLHETPADDRVAKLLEAAHETAPVGGELGIQQTAHVLDQHRAWATLRGDLKHAREEIPRRFGFVHRAVAGQHGPHKYAGVVERYVERGRSVSHDRRVQADRERADGPGSQRIFRAFGAATGAHRFLRDLGGLTTHDHRRRVIDGGPFDARAVGDDHSHDQGERIAHLDGVGAHQEAGLDAGSGERRSHTGRHRRRGLPLGARRMPREEDRAERDDFREAERCARRCRTTWGEDW